MSSGDTDATGPPVNTSRAWVPAGRGGLSVFLLPLSTPPPQPPGRPGSPSSAQPRGPGWEHLHHIVHMCPHASPATGGHRGWWGFTSLGHRNTASPRSSLIPGLHIPEPPPGPRPHPVVLLRPPSSPRPPAELLPDGGGCPAQAASMFASGKSRLGDPGPASCPNTVPAPAWATDRDAGPP